MRWFQFGFETFSRHLSMVKISLCFLRIRMVSLDKFLWMNLITHFSIQTTGRGFSLFLLHPQHTEDHCPWTSPNKRSDWSMEIFAWSSRTTQTMWSHWFTIVTLLLSKLTPKPKVALLMMGEQRAKTSWLEQISTIQIISQQLPNGDKFWQFCWEIHSRISIVGNVCHRLWFFLQHCQQPYSLIFQLSIPLPPYIQ